MDKKKIGIEWNFLDKGNTMLGLWVGSQTTHFPDGAKIFYGVAIYFGAVIFRVGFHGRKKVQ